MKKRYAFSSALVLTCLLSLVTNAQNNALSLNGTSTVVNCTNSASLNATVIKTMECWVKFNSLADGANGQEILSRSKINNGIELLIYNSSLAFYCMYNGSTGSSVSYPVSNLQANVWYHIAASWDGSTKESMRLFVNGISVGSRTDYIGNINTTGITTPASSYFYIGQWSETGIPRYLNGTVDEVRVWSVYRQATDIKAGMYRQYPSGTPNLIAYYKFDESSGTTVVNEAGNTSLNGTISGTANRIASPVGFSSNALNFNGSSNKVRVPANNLLNLSSGTVECWMRPGNLSTTYGSCLVGNRGVDGTRFSIHISQTTIGLWNNTDWKYLNYNFTAGTCYHVAVVSDVLAGKSTIYVNGVKIGELTNVFGTLTGQPLTIGASENFLGDGEWFYGDIDDVRLWNTVRSRDEIYNNMNTPLTGVESGLVANYTFNAGIAGGNNAGLVYAIDATANSLHGVLSNFNLLSTSSNYISSAVVILPVQLTDFTGVKNGNSSLLKWNTAQEQNSKQFVVQRSLDGSAFSAIGTVAAAGNSTGISRYTFTDAQPASGINYYRLQLVDADGKTTVTKTVAVNFPSTELVKISPNPASSILHYNVTSLQQVNVIVNVINAMGQRINSKTVVLQVGNNSLSMDVSHLPAGTYTLQVINTPAGIADNQRFQVAK